MRHLAGLFLAVVLIAVLAPTATAHFKLISPQSWIVENVNATMYKDKDTAEHALVGSFSFLRRFRNSGGQHRPKALEKIATARCRGGGRN